MWRVRIQYPRDWNCGTIRKVVDEHGAYLMADIAHHIGSGLPLKNLPTPSTAIVLL